MADIKNYAIFEVGKWNGMEFTEEDLEDIATNFNELSEVQKVPLKLGHNDEQPVTDGQPALGWVRNLRRVGKQLLADFADVPGVIKTAIQKKLYRTVSIELLLGVKRGERLYNHVLDAVAILGADQPAVKTLKDLDQYLAARGAFDSTGHRIVFETQVGKRQNDNEGDKAMDEREVQKMIKAAVAEAVAPFKSEVEELRSKNEELRKKFGESEDKNLDLERENKRFKADQEDQAKERQKEAIKLARTNVTVVLDEAVKAKRITPAQRDQAIKMFGIDDDERIVKLELDDLKAYYSLEKGAVGLSSDQDTTASGGGESDRQETDPHKEIDRLIRVQMGTNGKSYREAAKAVFISNPDLHREYLKTPPPERLEGGN